MGRINILDEATSNKIAAGEVVERPFSVVKELIENSLDANSKNIIVEINEGGHKLIKLTDDGDGIHPDDIKKAFLPHATSKINYIDDIYRINTLGFRGEALASIASVSKVLLKSRTPEFETGREIYISGGNIEHFTESGCNVGTTIEVNDIFFNIPARLKFLKSPQRETALINDIIERLALINTQVSFKVFNNNNKIFNTYSSNSMIDTIRAIYGKNTVENITYFEKHFDLASIYGYIGNADLSRGSRNNQSIYVNKRYIKNKLITTAVENAFKSFLTINKYPFFILFIDIFPDLIDVNVHPTKAEVKFKDDRILFKMVFDTIHEAIRKSLKDSFDIPADIYEDTNTSIPKRAEANAVQIPIDLKSDDYSYSNLDNNKSDSNFNSNSNQNIYGDFVPYGSIHDGEDAKYTLDKSNSSVPYKHLDSETIEPKFMNLTVIGQFKDSYILAQGGEELYIIDQHAAHEKILFEKYMKEVKNRTVIAQILVSPVILELASEDFSTYSENIEIFNRTGFKIEVFGENTISIREVPIILGESKVKKLFIEIIDNIKAMGSGETTEIKYLKIATLACKSAVKANNKLSMIEMDSLINQLRFINDPFTCPHGRPTIIKITLNELEKRFKRIQ